jgi:UDP-glucose 4-epimerase
MNYLIVGGAGFIGSYCVDELLRRPTTKRLRVYDNFSSGQRWHLEQHSADARLEIIAKDIYDEEIFVSAKDTDAVFMFAANPDIAKAVTEPDIDFRQGTALVQITLEAMRKAGCKTLLYASGSGVYGDVGVTDVREDYAPMEPISTYGASKLGCEALISSYCQMFDFRASAFRFGNVVGGRQTHGVAYDFIKRLRVDPSRLAILGNGTQSKPYVYVDDVLNAMSLAAQHQTKVFDVYNVAPNDYTTVTEIAEMVLNEMGISLSDCKLMYGDGSRGWKGDVPIVRLNTQKIRSLGWNNTMTSNGAIQKSIGAMMSNSEKLFV